VYTSHGQIPVWVNRQVENLSVAEDYCLLNVTACSLVQNSWTFRFKELPPWTGFQPIHEGVNFIGTIVSFLSPSLFYLLAASVEVVYFHLITLRHTPQSVGLLWKRDRPVAETSTWQHKHCTRQTSTPPGGIRTRNPSKRSAANVSLRPRGHWD
jgi:hypothetical protein